jgi:hypothetical protein
MAARVAFWNFMCPLIRRATLKHADQVTRLRATYPRLPSCGAGTAYSQIGAFGAAAAAIILFAVADQQLVGQPVSIGLDKPTGDEPFQAGQYDLDLSGICSVRVRPAPAVRIGRAGVIGWGLVVPISFL